MSQHDDTDSRAVEQLAGTSTANESVHSPTLPTEASGFTAESEFDWVPSPELAAALAKMAGDLLASIEAEQNKPLVAGEPAYRGNCKWHPIADFPLRGSRAGAREDNASHSSTPGSHWVDVEEILPGSPEYAGSLR